MPDPMQKVSVQSDPPPGKKLPKLADILGYFGDRIELIPFALCQASPDTSLEYPQPIIFN